MIYLWMFLALCIVCVSGYIGQVLNVVSAVSSFFGMVILAALIYYFMAKLCQRHGKTLPIWWQNAGKVTCWLVVCWLELCSDIITRVKRYWADSADGFIIL